jgi:hypothetical protein
MKILLIDRHGPTIRRIMLEEDFRMNGYDVVSTTYLKELPNHPEVLSATDVAVAHPSPEDANLLEEEVKRRSDFRVIVFGVKANPENEDRVTYIESFADWGNKIMALLDNYRAQQTL